MFKRLRVFIYYHASKPDTTQVNDCKWTHTQAYTQYTHHIHNTQTDRHRQTDTRTQIHTYTYTQDIQTHNTHAYTHTQCIDRQTDRQTHTEVKADKSNPNV